MSHGPDWVVSTLCRYLANHQLTVPGIFVLVPTSRLLAQELERLTGVQYQLVKELLHMELRQSPAPRAVTGTLYVAKEHDAEQLAGHRKALQAESNTQRPFDSAQSVQQDLQKKALYTWVNRNDRIVASTSLYLD